MIHNFESWRTATEATYKDGKLRHYHRVQDDVWRSVRNLLQRLLCMRIDGNAPGCLSLDDEACNALLVFLDEMQLAYIHPRSTSAKFYFETKKKALPSPNV